VAWFAGEGTRVTLTYETEFANGTGSEEFLWHVHDGQALLFGYHINSKELILK